MERAETDRHHQRRERADGAETALHLYIVLLFVFAFPTVEAPALKAVWAINALNI